MKIVPFAQDVLEEIGMDWPSVSSLSALRAWYEGMSSSDAVARYLPNIRADGHSSRTALALVRRQLAARARACHREDLAVLFLEPAAGRTQRSRRVLDAIELLRHLRAPLPLLTDAVAHWFPPRLSHALTAHGLLTLADLLVRATHRRTWWAAVPGVGAAGARLTSEFLAAHPDLTRRAQTLLPAPVPAGHEIVPWERLHLPRELDGSNGAFRAPPSSCVLGAGNDYEAVQAWLSLHEAAATQRAYRKEAERLILWAIVERGRALSSLTTEDAVAYRTFLRRPVPRSRWVGRAAPRTAAGWKPFTGDLSTNSAGYALSVIGALFRWLIQQRYVLANPFAGIKVRGDSRSLPQGPQRAFGEGEWAIIQAVAEGLEWVHGWDAPAAQRLRFVLDFGYATGLRIGEFTQATLGQIEVDHRGDHWLRLTGKGAKPAKVVLPLMARAALERYLAHRHLPTSPERWAPATPLLTGLDSAQGISSARLWSVMRRFFRDVARIVAPDSPALSERLLRASPHWMRHTHATHALAHGAELTTVRDNLRHASVSTTSTYLHTDEVRRARQMEAAFEVPGRGS
ncbi:phage integrase family protein [Variovorax gossypii]